ncbi:MAG TPA: Mov34/MPN/PAD-1 family protein, partial [Gammaproteobacteria bacterium]|nr:Mov34/MPN/PAD-1 family protein [Gammaproteobacteria bacterium]
MAIEISAADVKAIRGHGEAALPNECCGFMLGKVDGDSRRVEELKSADNDREDKAQYNRFLITPEAFMRGEKAAREKDLDIIGFYHS